MKIKIFGFYISISRAANLKITEPQYEIGELVYTFFEPAYPAMVAGRLDSTYYVLSDRFGRHIRLARPSEITKKYQAKK